MARTSVEVEELWNRFHEAVNMTSQELSAWIGTEPDVDAPRPGEPGPPPLGSAVVDILGKRRSDVTDADLTSMEKVIDVVESETSGLVKDDIVADERKRHRLMNVGHDPIREQ